MQSLSRVAVVALASAGMMIPATSTAREKRAVPRHQVRVCGRVESLAQFEGRARLVYRGVRHATHHDVVGLRHMRLCSASPTRAGRYWAAQARLNAHRRHVVWLASRSPAGYLMLTFEQARMTRAGAAGVVGNFQQESGLNPAEGGSSGLGLGQWNGARVTALYTFAASHHEQALSLEAQAGFTIYELEGSYGSTLAYLRSATDPQAAAVMFEEAYERAGLPNNQAREAYALAAYNHGP